MTDPRTTNLVGAHVRLVKRANRSSIGRGVVRAVHYHQHAFVLMIEALGDAPWFGAGNGGLFQVSLLDETMEVVIEGAT